MAVGGKAIRTETTINDTRDFGIGKRLTNLPALRQIGFTASRRLLGAQKLSHDPITGAAALAQVTDPVITETGTRVAGLRLTDPRSLALLAVLCVFRLLPNGFTNADLRRHLAPMLGKTPGLMTSGQITCDLRRLRHHGLIERIPHTFRYRVTGTGMRSARYLTRLHDRLLRTGQIELQRPGWMVVWGVYSRQYVAFPLFAAPAGTIVAAAYPPALESRMQAAELRAQGKPRHRSG